MTTHTQQNTSRMVRKGRLEKGNVAAAALF